MCARVTRDDKVCVVWSEDRARDAFAGGVDAARHAHEMQQAEAIRAEEARIRREMHDETDRRIAQARAYMTHATCTCT